MAATTTSLSPHASATRQPSEREIERRCQEALAENRLYKEELAQMTNCAQALQAQAAKGAGLPAN